MSHAPNQYNAAPPPAPNLPPEAAQDADRTDRNLDVLDEMIRAGVELVRRARAELETTPDKEANLSQVERCARLVRNVERSVALQTRIIKDRHQAAARHQRQAAESAATTRTERKRHLAHAMGEAIKAAPQEKAAALTRRFHARMHDWDIEQDLAHRSVDAALTRLRTEFGIAPPSPEAPPTSPTEASPDAPAARAPIPLTPAANARLERLLARHHPPPPGQ